MSDAPAAAGAGTALNARQMLISLGVACASTVKIERLQQPNAAACLYSMCTPKSMWVFGRRRANLAGKEPPAGQAECEHAV